MKNFYDELSFFSNSHDVLAELKIYLDKKLNIFNFHEWYKPIHQIGGGTYAQVILLFKKI